MAGTDLMPSGGVPDTFTGTNGAALNATNWTIATNQGAGGGATIQGNQGRITTGTTSGNRTSIRLLTAAILNQEIVFDWVVPVAGTMFANAWVRTPTAVDTASGYYFGLAANDMICGYGPTTTPYASTDTVTYTHGFTAGQIVTTRIAVFGGTGTKTIKARTWLAGSSEPTSTWQVNTTDTHTVNTAAYVGVTINSSTAGSKNFFIDNFDIHDAETPSQATLAATATITPTGTLLNVTTKKFVGTITPTGALVKTRAVPKTFTGAITSAGTLKKIAPKVFTGLIMPVGLHAKQSTKLFTGAMTPAATLKRIATRKFAGSVTSSGVTAVLYLGRVFGRPGIVVMSVLQRVEVRLRHRKG